MIRSSASELLVRTSPSAKDRNPAIDEQHHNKCIVDVSSDGIPANVLEVDKQLIGPLREIAPKMVDASDRNLIARFRASWLGRFYIDHLKRYPIIRGSVIWIWGNWYPRYIKYIATPILSVRFLFDEKRRQQLRWRELVRQSNYVARNSLQVAQLSSASEVETPVPLAFPVEDRGYLMSPHERYVFPEITVVEVPQAVVYGLSNLVLAGDDVLCHDLYDFSRDSTSEELDGRMLIDAKKGRIRWFLHDEAPESVLCAAVFTDATAPNYAHWLTEVLPRIAMFCAEEKFAHVPIIVDAGLHRNLMESLRLIAGDQREIICLPVGRAIAVEQLYLTSTCGYVPFGRRNTKLAAHSHGLFSSVALGKVCTRLVEAAQQLGDVDLPEKIYLRRTSGTRKVINVAEIERILLSRGFSIVEPEKLSFLEQVRLFSNAKVVVGSSGAALANIVFCPPEAEINILISTFVDTSYWYWQNIACATGKEVHYIFGSTIHGGLIDIHANFYIDPIILMERKEYEY